MEGFTWFYICSVVLYDAETSGQWEIKKWSNYRVLECDYMEENVDYQLAPKSD